MANSRFRMIEGWIDKAFNQLQTAREHLKSSYRYSEAIEAAQECIELSVKSTLSLLGVRFSATHSWEHNKKEFAEIAAQIQDRQLMAALEAHYLNHVVCLPRLLFIANLWAQFYIIAKYGFETGHLASAKELFKKEEADLAVLHVDECYQAASKLRYLDKEKMKAILSAAKDAG